MEAKPRSRQRQARLRRRKPDGTWWGYHSDGKPDFEQMLRVPELDYNVLTAGQLGCPPDKRIFKVLDVFLEVWAIFVITAVAGSFSAFFGSGDAG